jgi:hypothetical protein
VAEVARFDATEVRLMIQDPQVEAYSFRARVCLGIAVFGFAIFVVGILMSVF